MEGKFQTITRATSEEVDIELNNLIKENFVRVLGITNTTKTFTAMIYLGNKLPKKK